MGFAEESSSARPQSLMLSFLGVYVLGRGRRRVVGQRDRRFQPGRRLRGGGALDPGADGQAGAADPATRGAAGLRRPDRSGRATCSRTAQARVWETGAVNRDWDGTWTVVSFSLPDTRRRERHELRSRLVWEGFGPLHNGQWIAAGPRPVVAVVAEPLGLGRPRHGAVGASHRPERRSATWSPGRSTPTRSPRATALSWIVGTLGAPLPGLPDDLARQLAAAHRLAPARAPGSAPARAAAPGRLARDPRGRDLSQARRGVRRVVRRDRRGGPGRRPCRGGGAGGLSACGPGNLPAVRCEGPAHPVRVATTRRSSACRVARSESSSGRSVRFRARSASARASA